MEIAKIVVGLFAIMVAVIVFAPMSATFVNFVFSFVGGFLITSGIIGIIRNNR